MDANCDGTNSFGSKNGIKTKCNQSDPLVNTELIKPHIMT